MPQLSGTDGDELGANDELLAFKDEGEQRGEDRGAAADRDLDRDLDDVKSSLVNESESRSSSDSEEAERRAGAGPGPGARPGAGPEQRNRARHSQLLGEALRRQQDGSLFTPPPYVGYPFFMIPDLGNLGNLCAPYLANGALAPGARTYLPFQWPLLDVPGRAAMRDSSTPTHLASNVPMVQHPHMSHLHPLLSYSPETISPQRASPGFSPDTGVSRPPHAACYPVSPGGVAQLPHPLSWLQGQTMYPLAGGFSPATLAMNASMSSLVSSSFSPRLVQTPQPSTHHAAIKQEPGAYSPSGKSVSVSQQEKEEEKKPHIKKPLNAFMLYMREERPLVVAQCNVKESATINQILGQRWHSLSKDQQAKYYEMARKERLLHSKLYPGWSARDNYGKKKKRKRAKSETQLDALPEDLAPQPKRPQAAALDMTHTHSLLTHSQAPPLHARPHPPSQPQHTVSHLTHTHLSQASPASSLDSPATPTTALASPAAPAQTHTEHTHSSSCHSGHTPPYGEQLQPLSLTTKPQRAALPPPRRTTPGPHTPSSDTPSPLTPPPFLAPPPSSSHHFRRGSSQL